MTRLKLFQGDQKIINTGYKFSDNPNCSELFVEPINTDDESLFKFGFYIGAQTGKFLSYGEPPSGIKDSLDMCYSWAGSNCNNKNEIEAPTENIYEAISIIAKRANQINSDLKKELVDKLDEFATYNDSLEEVFENKEQIEVSKFYERLPKPTAIAVEEWLNGKVYHRNPEAE